ncbi:arsenate reductase (glutaredoxin) [Microbulbifer sp. TYP-18]|uniref:arsenate reductase (glutaredoxin) n=1 Tax=Microbulbifer sp. TYP-18 TaxID=3230024 RepID=UPI0034C6002E
MWTIYHNPRCSKSRQTMQLLQDRGIEPNTVLYLETPPSATTLAELLRQLGITARDLLRTGEEEYKALQLGEAGLSEAQLIDAMAQHPRLIQRPIVVNGDKAVVARPPEKVLELL